MPKTRILILAGFLACLTSCTTAAMADTVTRSETTRTTTYGDDPVMIAPDADADTYTTTTATDDPQYLSKTVTTRETTYDTDNDHSYYLRDDRRIGQTYPIGTDNQGNNVLRYDNRTFDGYND